MARRATLKDVARAAGVSVTTVSLVLNGRPARVSKEKRELIAKAAKELHYVPNQSARSLVTKQSKLVALIVPDIENLFFAALSKCVEDECAAQGYSLIVANSDDSRATEHDLMVRLASRGVDGMMLIPARESCAAEDELRADVEQVACPVVLIDRYFEPAALPYVTTNNYEGGFNATKYLIGFGHRDILCIRGVPHSMPARERERGYLDALREAGLEDRARIAGNDFSIQNGYLETKFALSGSARPTAIFAMSNTILLGTIKAIKESELRIPDDISVVSFDNYTYLDYLDPAITRVSQRISEMGALAVKILLQRIEGTGNDDAKIQLSPQLIVCNSVAHAHGEK